MPLARARAGSISTGWDEVSCSEGLRGDMRRGVTVSDYLASNQVVGSSNLSGLTPKSIDCVPEIVERSES